MKLEINWQLFKVDNEVLWVWRGLKSEAIYFAHDTAALWTGIRGPFGVLAALFGTIVILFPAHLLGLVLGGSGHYVAKGE